MLTFDDAELNRAVSQQAAELGLGASDDPFDNTNNNRRGSNGGEKDGQGQGGTPAKRRRTQPSFYKYAIHPHASKAKIELVTAPGHGDSGSLWVSAELLIEYLLTTSSEKQPAAVRLNPSLLAGGLEDADADAEMSAVRSMTLGGPPSPRGSFNAMPLRDAHEVQAVRNSYRQATSGRYGGHIVSGSNATPVSPRMSLTPTASANGNGGGGTPGGGLLVRTPSTASRASTGSAHGGQHSPWAQSRPAPWAPSSPTATPQRVKTSVQDMLADAQLRTLYNHDGSRNSLSRYMANTTHQMSDAAFRLSGGETPASGRSGSSNGTATTSLFYSGSDESRISYGENLGTVLELGAGLGAPSIALALNGKARRIICEGLFFDVDFNAFFVQFFYYFHLPHCIPEWDLKQYIL